MPVRVGANDSDVAMSPSPSGTREGNAGVPAHVASPGPYKRNSTVEPATGFTRPTTVALSRTWPPRTMSAEANVEMAGVADPVTGAGGGAAVGIATVTTADGSPQAVATAL